MGGKEKAMEMQSKAEEGAQKANKWDTTTVGTALQLHMGIKYYKHCPNRNTRNNTKILFSCEML